MRNNIKVISLICSMAMLMLSKASFAGDKIYPGSMCKAYFANQQSYLQYVNGATLYNNSSYAVWLACPVPKDPIRTTSRQYASVMVLHSGYSTSSFVCRFFNIASLTGDIINVTTNSMSSYWAGRDEEIAMSIPNINNTVNSLACRVPPYSEVRNYRIHEY